MSRSRGAHPEIWWEAGLPLDWPGWVCIETHFGPLAEVAVKEMGAVLADAP